MHIKIPKSIKEGVLRKKDLTSEEKKIYNDWWDNHYQTCIPNFLNSSKKYQEKHQRVFSVFLLNTDYSWLAVPLDWDVQSDSKTGTTPPAVLNYKKLLKSEFFTDENKFKFFMRKLAGVRSPFSLNPETIQFNNPENEELFKETVPVYAMCQAIHQRNWEQLLEAHYKKPSLLYNHWAIKEFFKILPTPILNKVLRTDPKKFSPFFYNIPNVKKKFVTETTLKALVGANASSIKYIPKEQLTEGILRIAFQKSGGAIQYAPPKLLTDELVRIAIKTTPSALKYVPKKFHTSRNIMHAVLNSETSKKYIKGKK